MISPIRRANILFLGCGLWLLACGDAPPDVGGITGGDGTTGATGGPTTGAAPTSGGSTESATENSTAADAASDEGRVFFSDPDGGHLPCDLFAQDCPEGEKCALWAADGGNYWTSVKCVPITGDGQPGEPCTMEISQVSGLDDCEEGAMCWDVDAQLQGLCVALCIGSADMPTCADEDVSCSITAEGVIHVCLPDCDPLLQDCLDDTLCLPIADEFRCVLDASGDAGTAFDPCEFANACDPGLVCAVPDSAIECDPQASGCCTPMCGLDDADFMCPGVGQACVSLYEEGMAPPKWANIGYCTVPR